MTDPKNVLDLGLAPIPAGVRIAALAMTSNYAVATVYGAPPSDDNNLYIYSIEDSRFVGQVGVSRNYVISASQSYVLAHSRGRDEAGTIYEIDEEFEGILKPVGQTRPVKYAQVQNTVEDDRLIYSGCPGSKSTLEGEVICYERGEDGAVNYVGSIMNPYPNGKDAFGQYLSLDGNYLFVLAPSDDTVATNRGTLYVYDLSDGFVEGMRPIRSLSDWPDKFVSNLIASEAQLFLARRGNGLFVRHYNAENVIDELPLIEEFSRDEWGSMKAFGLIEGNIAFVGSTATPGQQLFVVDSDPNSGTYGGQLSATPIPGDKKLEIMGFNRTSCPSTSLWLWLIDNVSNPQDPGQILFY